MYRIHWSVELDTFGGNTPSGDKFVGLVFMDKETGDEDGYLLSIDLAKDLGNELVRLADIMEKRV